MRAFLLQKKDPVVKKKRVLNFTGHDDLYTANKERYRVFTLLDLNLIADIDFGDVYSPLKFSEKQVGNDKNSSTNFHNQSPPSPAPFGAGQQINSDFQYIHTKTYSKENGKRQ